ncbi:MAG: MATE family efflux transporter [Ruminococcaceae bacterium]|nr:MATE family efflux transporter [Oscillospiraceae bacterium]
MTTVKNKTDLTQGSVLKKMLIFAIPIIFTNLLQQLYHTADMAVVGNCADEPTIAMAAVGSTTAITALCLNLFLGLAVGANVVCARLYGAKQETELRRAMHTSLLLAAVCGIGIGILGVIFAEHLLALTGTPVGVVREQGALYMRIIFLGQPGSLLYNFGAGILRSHGDTKRPMYILMTSGLVNVILNFIFVLAFNMESAGVALATVISYYLSAAAVLWILFSPHGEFRLRLSELSLGKAVRPIAGVGIPSGLNSMVFSLSNVIIVAALNKLGKDVLAANSAAHNVDAILYQVLVAFYTACISFAGQNYGAKKYDRIDKLWKTATLMAISLFLVIGVISVFSAPWIMRLFTREDPVVLLGAARIAILCGSYAIYVIPELSIGCMRGMGKSVLPSALNVVCICVPRIIWVLLAYPALAIGGADPTFETLLHDYKILLWCYPISWAISGVAQFFCYRYYRKKLNREAV